MKKGRRIQKFSDDGVTRVPAQILLKKEHREILHEYCDTYLGISISSYFNEFFMNDESLKRWLREKGKKLD